MGLETGDYLDDLVITNPVGSTDVVGTLDDHIRLLKKTVTQSFPNVDGAVNPTVTEFNRLVGLGGDIIEATGAQSKAGALTLTDRPIISSTSPSLLLFETDADADEKRWSIATSGGDFYLGTRNDVDAGVEDVLQITQTAGTIDIINFLNGTLQSGGAAVHYVGGTDVAVADGGTGSSTAAGARANLGFTPTYHIGYEYIRLIDSKSSGTNGGTFTTGAWRKRTLTEDTDTGNDCSVASSQFTLGAGTYIIQASAPAFAVDRHQTILYNVSDTSTEIVGTVEQASSTDAGSTRSQVNGSFTIAGSKTFELQHQCMTTESANGFGIAGSFTTELYSIVELWKIA